MPETDLAAAITQFGVAGLIGWMWLTERRAAAARDRQLTEAHDRLEQERTKLSTLLVALDRNTQALSAVETGQRRLADLLDRLLLAPPTPTRPAGAKRTPCPTNPDPDHPSPRGRAA